MSVNLQKGYFLNRLFMPDLDLISTSDLIHELASRHKELIVLREHKKGVDSVNVFIKTGFGCKGRRDLGFDLVEATDILQAAHKQLVYEYLDDVDA